MDFLLSTIKFKENEQILLEEAKYEYVKRVGSIFFPAIIIRPDIIRIISNLAEFVRNPSDFYSVAVNRIITYLYNTRYLILKYSVIQQNYN